MFNLLNKWFVNAPTLPETNHWVNLLTTFPKAKAPHYELNYDKKHQTSMRDLLTAISQNDVTRFQESLELGYQTKQTEPYYQYFQKVIDPIQTYRYSQHALHQMFQTCRNFTWPEKMREGVQKIHDELLPQLLTQAENLPNAQFKIFKTNYQKLMNDYDQNNWTKESLLDNPTDLKRQYYQKFTHLLIDNEMNFKKLLPDTLKLVNPLLTRIMHQLLTNVLPTNADVTPMVEQIKQCHTLESIIDWCLLATQFNQYHQKVLRLPYPDYLALATNLAVDFNQVIKQVPSLKNYNLISYCLPESTGIPVKILNSATETNIQALFFKDINYLDPTYTIAYEQCQKLKLENPFAYWPHLMPLNDFKTALTNQDNRHLKLAVDDEMLEIIKSLAKGHWHVNQNYLNQEHQTANLLVGLNQIDDTIRYTETNEPHKTIVLPTGGHYQWPKDYLMGLEKLID